MEINGKTYRNLESQVGYLTEVAEQLDAKITEVAAQIPSKMIVEELPETGDPLITYYVGPRGTDPNYYYALYTDDGTKVCDWINSTTGEIIFENLNNFNFRKFI